MTAALKKREAENTDHDIHDLHIENRRILVVEDETTLSEAYMDILTNRRNVTPAPVKSSRLTVSPVHLVDTSNRKPPPFEVVVCNTPQEAINKVNESIKNNKPFAMGFFDVLLNDRIDGIQLVKQIFEIDPKIYAVFVTAYQDRTVDSIHEILGESNAERWDYLNKPFSQNEILQKARNLVTVWNLGEDRRHKTEQLLEATKRLIESDRFSAVAAIARSVGHEFGNILLQISGTAELNQNSNEEKMRKALSTILQASDTASSILEKFKNLTRPADSIVKKEELALSAVVEEARQLMEHHFEKLNIRFCMIKNDKVRLRINRASMVQVLVNLFINATHVMPHGGQIDVSIEQIGNNVHLKVRDYGPGITQDVLNKIFEPFFTTKGDKGTGLGLAICKEIIEIEHGGHLSAGNHPGKGAEFRIELPTSPLEEE